MEGSRRERYGNILKKAEKYLHRHQGSETSATTDPSVAPPIKGAGESDGGSTYKAYLQKAKEFMQKKDDNKENQVGEDVNQKQDKKKQYAALGAGLLAARKTYMMTRKGQNKNKSGNEGEGEEEEEEEDEDEDDEEVDDEESSGWFTEFMEGMSEFFAER